MYKLLKTLPLLGLVVLLTSGSIFLVPNPAHAQEAAGSFTQQQVDTGLSLIKLMEPFIKRGDPSVLPKTSGIVCKTSKRSFPISSDIAECTQNSVTVTCDHTVEADTGVANGSCIATDAKGNIIPKVFSGESGILPTSDTPALKEECTGSDCVTTAPQAEGCFGLSIFSLTCLLNGMFSIIAKIASFIMGLVAALLGLANYLLGWSTYVTVYQFGNLIGNSQGLLDAWGVLRDFANIVLLFGFIFMGISTILNLSHSEYTAKRALPTLIIFALLLNFSLLASEAVIDVSNAIATSIYNQAGGTCDASQSIDCITDKGIGGKVMDMAGVGSAFGGAWLDSISDGPRDAIIIVGLTLFLLITAVVIFAAAIMLIIRAVILGFLMVTSPIGFAGMAIPPLHEVAKTWWSQLLAQAFFAPIYFLLVFVGLKMMEGIATSLNTTGNINDATLANVFINTSQSGGSSNVSIGITFALLIGFMVAALMFAKRSSAIGTGFAIKGAGGLAFGTLGYVGRNTAGRASLAVSERIRSSKFGRTGLGRFTYGIANKGATASFDGRTSTLGKGLAKQVGDLGTPNKDAAHGIHGIEEKLIKDRVDHAKTIKQTKEEERAEANLTSQKTQKEDAKALEIAQGSSNIASLRDEVGNYETKIGADSEARKKAIAEQEDKVASAERLMPGSPAHDAEKDALKKLKDAHLIQSQTESADLALRKNSLKAEQERHKNAKDAFDRDIRQIDTMIKGGTFYDQDGLATRYQGVNEDSAKREYGENITHERGMPFTLQGHANHTAGARVVRDAGKSEIQKALSKIEGSVETKNTPAPAPPTTGTDPGPAH